MNLTIVEPSRYFPIYFAGKLRDLVPVLDAGDDRSDRLHDQLGLPPEPDQSVVARDGAAEGIHRGDPAAQRHDRPAGAVDTSPRRGAVPLDQSWALPTNLRLPTYGIAKPVRGFGVDPADAPHPQGHLGGPVAGGAQRERDGRGWRDTWSGACWRRASPSSSRPCSCSRWSRPCPATRRRSSSGTGARRSSSGACVSTLASMRPSPVQYARWLGRVASGDLGYSMLNGIPVRDTLARTLPVTLQLAAWALGRGSADRPPHGHLRRHPPQAPGWRASWAGTTGSRSPCPSSGSGSCWRGSSARPGALGAALGLRALRGQSRRLGAEPDPARAHARRRAWGRSWRASSRLHWRMSSRADYVRTAPRKGLPPRGVVLRHALRNALVPIITGLRHPGRVLHRRRGHHRGGLRHPGLGDGAVALDPDPRLPGDPVHHPGQHRRLRRDQPH